MRVLVAILFLTLTKGYTQELIPLAFNRIQHHFNNKPKPQYRTSGDTLQLPFVEEFSTSEINPPSYNFVDTGGTYINNRYCVNPPTKNVASFDGLNQYGEPYNEISQFARGKCDFLQSQPINLEGKNDIYMSFWWQAQGNATPQVSTDSLHLMFLDNDSTWSVVWSTTGQELNDFELENLKIDSSFLHSGFRFMFESFGNQSGMFGVWHVDYIYIDDDRSENDTLINDIAYSNTPSSFLDKYWAMPVWHFFDNPSNYLNDSITSTLNNFKDDGSGLSFIIETEASLIDKNSGNSIQIHNNSANSILPTEKQKLVTATNSEYSFISSEINYTTIETRFSVISNDQNIGDSVNNEIVEFSTTQNDTISSHTTLAEYYAYDDGTAEQAFRITTQDGLLLQEFEVQEEDTLFGMSIHFSGNPFQYDSNQLILMVWDSVKVGDVYDADNILWDERVLISVADSLNGFAKYEFLEPIIVKGKYYIGFRQDSDFDVLIGYDINSSPGFEPIYFNTNGTWQRFQLNEGVLMIRPHFKRLYPNSLPTKLKELDVNLYPNPAHDDLFLSEKIEKIEVYNVSGSSIISEQNVNQLDISNLENGMYFIFLQHQGKVKRTKFIKH